MKMSVILVTSLITASCLGGRGIKGAATDTIKIVESPKQYTVNVVNSYPHNTNSYTQGLVFFDGVLYEGTGLYGESRLMEVSLEDGKILRTKPLSKKYFGEGIALLNDKIYQLTWEHGVGIIYDRKTFDKTGEFKYSGEGWGITSDGTKLYMSDGTNLIRIIDPQTMRTVGSIDVKDDNGSVIYLNELEWIEGEIWANVYGETRILRIDPQSGNVAGIINLESLLPMITITAETDVLNGIAYDQQNKRVFVTGKNWNKIFEITVR